VVEDLNLATLWETVADTVPASPAVVQGDTMRTWSELESRAARLAGAFAAAGVTQGSRVAIGCYNCPEYLETVFAAFKARAAPVNLNYRYRSSELAQLLTDSGASVVVFHGALADRVHEAVDQLEHSAGKVLLVEVADGTAGPSGAARFEELVEATDPAPRRGRSGGDEFLLYTGGTTGLPRGVLWRHRAVFGMHQSQFAALGVPVPLSAADLAVAVAGLHGAHRAPTALVVSPLMHGTGIFTSMGTFSQGGTVVLCQSRSLDPDEICRLVDTYRIRQLSIVGDAFARPILAALEAAAAAGRPYDLSSLERITSIGVTWSAEVKAGLLRHADVVLVDVVAASEGAGFASAETRRGEVVQTGRFRLGTSAKVVRADGTDVIPGSGEVGFLAATGPLPDGYLNDPDKTARTWWTIGGVRYVVPGDMATVEPDGAVVLLGRGSEVVNSGGEKVFVEEVEQVISSHPDVEDVLVVGVPDERFGTRVAAVVQLAAGASSSAQSIIDHVGSRLADHKRPRQVVFVDSVPRSPAGKADRPGARAIVASAEGGTTGQA
jgi:3-oxocholest-4-en-26-oate---CoA ligase